MVRDFFHRIQHTVQHSLRRYPRWLRLVSGVALLFGGILGFLPILGFWMFPLGFLVLSYDLPRVRRWRRRAEVRCLRRQRRGSQQ